MSKRVNETMTPDDALHWLRNRYSDRPELLELCARIAHEWTKEGRTDIGPYDLLGEAQATMSESDYAAAANLADQEFTSD